MIAQALRKPRMTPEAYLAFEKWSEISIHPMGDRPVAHTKAFGGGCSLLEAHFLFTGKLYLFHLAL